MPAADVEATPTVESLREAVKVVLKPTIGAPWTVLTAILGPTAIGID